MQKTSARKFLFEVLKCLDHNPLLFRSHAAMKSHSNTAAGGYFYTLWFAKMDMLSPKRPIKRILLCGLWKQANSLG